MTSRRFGEGLRVKETYIFKNESDNILQSPWRGGDNLQTLMSIDVERTTVGESHLLCL